MLMIFTGDGKGKTTAALGQALRKLGWGEKVLLIQFLKGQEYGEINALKSAFPSQVKIYQTGPPEICSLKEREIRLEPVKRGWEFLISELERGEYGLIILDELNLVLSENLLEPKMVLNFLKEKKELMDIVLTGRRASQELIDLADLATEMKEVKHPFAKGVMARKGVEY